MKTTLTILLLTLFLVLSCSEGGTPSPTMDGDADPDTDAIGELDIEREAATDGDREAPDGDAEPDSDRDADTADAEPEWTFDRDNYEPVHGWILLDANPDAVRESIETAAEYGVNHIQLSHGLIMNIDELLGDPPEADIETLNMGIQLAHDNGMKAYIWVHELSMDNMTVCYDPEDPAWEARADVYREALALLPGLDGLILMFGSSPAPPWYSLCSCNWCVDNYGDNPFEAPPADVRIKIITEKLGGVLVNELGKELFIRTFVHEPAEIGFHSDGLSAVEGVEFTGMHKGPVQDWQPYNPHHGSTGHIGPHPSVLELDVAGEYWGQSVLPMCAPGYFRYRMNHMWQNRGIGAVIRIERGSYHALGTPNEINVRTVRELIDDPDKDLEEIWDGFISDFYGLEPASEAARGLKAMLKDTFPIRLKSHYVLGIWALDKGSDLPSDVGLDQFADRGEMPKWDADWQPIWDALDKPEMKHVLWIWQEGSEAVDMAERTLAHFQNIASHLVEAQRTDLERRLLHQKYAAEAWRAIDLFIWARRAYALDNVATLNDWQLWALAELARIKTAMIADGLQSVPLASPGRIQTFLDNVAEKAPDSGTATAPPVALFSYLHIDSVTATSARVSFITTHDVSVTLDYGLEIPDYGESVAVGAVTAGEEQTLILNDLPPNSRVVVRLRAEHDGIEWRGGDFWIFTKAK